MTFRALGPLPGLQHLPGLREDTKGSLSEDLWTFASRLEAEVDETSGKLASRIRQVENTPGNS